MVTVIGTSGLVIPKLSDPLSVFSGGSSSYVYSIPVFSSKASIYSFDIRGRGSLANYTAPSIAVVDYYDPSTNSITRDYHFIGGTNSASRINILSGSHDGQPMAGEIRIAIYGVSDVANLVPGLGVYSPWLGRLATGLSGTNSLSQNTGFSITEIDQNNQYDLSNGPLNSPNRISFIRPTGAVDWQPYPSTIQQRYIDFWTNYLNSGTTSNSRCFVAGTLITMADGTKKPIEEIDEGDIVLSFDPDANDGLGAAVPGKVTRTFTNVTRVLIDLWGLRVTPGHEFLSDRGEWMSVADILRRDRAFVRNEGNVGVLYRARTNSSLGSLGDAVFQTRFVDPRTGVERRAQVRGGIPFEWVISTEGGVISRRSAYLLEVLHYDGRISVAAYAENGRLCDGDDQPIGVLDWPAGTTPFDHEGAENYIVTLDGLPFVPEWIRNIPRDGEESRAVINAGGGSDDLLLLGPSGMITMKAENGQGVFNPPAPRQMLPPMRPTLAATNAGFVAPAMNRAQRRKQSALTRVK